jgi:hypothetical protein
LPLKFQLFFIWSALGHPSRGFLNSLMQRILQPQPRKAGVNFLLLESVQQKTATRNWVAVFVSKRCEKRENII